MRLRLVLAVPGVRPVPVVVVEVLTLFFTPQLLRAVAGVGLQTMPPIRVALVVGHLRPVRVRRVGRVKDTLVETVAPSPENTVVVAVAVPVLLVSSD